MLMLLAVLVSLFRLAVCLDLDADGMRWSQSQIDADTLLPNTNFFGTTVAISQDGSCYVASAVGAEEVLIYEKGRYGQEGTVWETTVRGVSNNVYSSNSDQFAYWNTDAGGARVAIDATSPEDNWESVLIAPRNLSSYAIPPFTAGTDRRSYVHEATTVPAGGRAVWIRKATLAAPTSQISGALFGSAVDVLTASGSEGRLDGVSGSAVDPLLPQVFTATVSAAGTQSGAALIAVGAAQGGSSPLGSGAVLIYLRNEKEWVLQATLLVPAGQGSASTRMGVSVSMSYSSGYNSAGQSSHAFGRGVNLFAGSNENKIFVFFLSQDPVSSSFGQWAVMQTIAARSSSGSTDMFGASISLSSFAMDDGRSAAIGAHGTSGGSGAAYAYEKLVQADGAGGWRWQWVEAAALVPPSGELVPASRYGQSVSISGGNIAVGVCSVSVSGSSRAGAAYVFRASGLNKTFGMHNSGLLRDRFTSAAAWALEQVVRPQMSEAGDLFGCALGIQASMVLVSQSNGDKDGGSAKPIGSEPGPTFYLRHTLAVGSAALATSIPHPLLPQPAGGARKQGGVVLFSTKTPNADGSTPWWQVGGRWRQGGQLVMWECNVGTAGCDASNTPTVDAEFGRTLAISALLPQSSTSTTAAMQVVVGQPQTPQSGLDFNPGLIVTFADEGEWGRDYSFYVPVTVVPSLVLLLLLLVGGCACPSGVGIYVRKGRKKRLGYLSILNDHQELTDHSSSTANNNSSHHSNRQLKRERGKGRDRGRGRGRGRGRDREGGVSKGITMSGSEDNNNESDIESDKGENDHDSELETHMHSRAMERSMDETGHSMASLELTESQVRTVRHTSEARMRMGVEVEAEEFQMQFTPRVSPRVSPRESSSNAAAGDVMTLRAAEPVSGDNSSTTAGGGDKLWSKDWTRAGRRGEKRGKRGGPRQAGVFDYEEDSELGDLDDDPYERRERAGGRESEVGRSGSDKAFAALERPDVSADVSAGRLWLESGNPNPNRSDSGKGKERGRGRGRGRGRCPDLGPSDKHSTILSFPSEVLFVDFVGSCCIAFCCYGFMHILYVMRYVQRAYFAFGGLLVAVFVFAVFPMLVLLGDIFAGYYPSDADDPLQRGYFSHHGNRGCWAYLRAWLCSGVQLKHLQTWHITPDNDDDVHKMAALLSDGGRSGCGIVAEQEDRGQRGERGEYGHSKTPVATTSLEHFYRARNALLSLSTSHQRGDAMLLLLVVGTCGMGTLGLLKYLPWRRTLFCVRSGGYPTYGFFKYCEHASFWLMLIFLLVVLQLLFQETPVRGVTSVFVSPAVDAGTFDGSETQQYYYSSPTVTPTGSFGLYSYSSTHDVYTFTPSSNSGVSLSSIDFNARLPTSDDAYAYNEGEPPEELDIASSGGWLGVIFTIVLLLRLWNSLVWFIYPLWRRNRTKMQIIVDSAANIRTGVGNFTSFCLTLFASALWTAGYFLTVCGCGGLTYLCPDSFHQPVEQPESSLQGQGGGRGTRSGPGQERVGLLSVPPSREFLDSNEDDDLDYVGEWDEGVEELFGFGFGEGRGAVGVDVEEGIGMTDVRAAGTGKEKGKGKGNVQSKTSRFFGLHEIEEEEEEDEDGDQDGGGGGGGGWGHDSHTSHLSYLSAAEKAFYQHHPRGVLPPNPQDWDGQHPLSPPNTGRGRDKRGGKEIAKEKERERAVRVPNAINNVNNVNNAKANGNSTDLKYTQTPLPFTQGSLQGENTEGNERAIRIAALEQQVDLARHSLLTAHADTSKDKSVEKEKDKEGVGEPSTDDPNSWNSDSDLEHL